MASEADPPPLFLIGWVQLLVLYVLTQGAYVMYWYVLRARDLARLGAPAGPLRLAAFGNVAIMATAWWEVLLRACWPGLVPDGDATMYFALACSLANGCLALVYAHALRKLGDRAPGMSTFLLQCLYLEFRMQLIPGVRKRGWTRADLGPVCVCLALAIPVWLAL